MTNQPHLIPPTKDERIATLKDKLEKYGKHSLYCCWVYEGGYYDRTLGCTCGLNVISMGGLDDIQRQAMPEGS